MTRVMVAGAVRTPLGNFCGQLQSLSEQQLGAAVMTEAVRRAGLPPEKIDEVIAGIAKQTSMPSNGGRHAMLLARLPERVPAYTVQRQSASGLQAVANGYWALKCGDAGVILAGGMESMSQIPFEIREARYAFDERRREIIDAIPAQERGAQPVDRYGPVRMAQVAERLARQYGLQERELTDYAEASLEKANTARGQGAEADVICPVMIKKGGKEETVSRDELIKAPELLAPPADGAAMCLLLNAEKAEEWNVPVLAEIAAVGIAACDPREMGLATVEASQIALGRAGSTLKEVDIVELHEISAAQSLAVIRQWQSCGVSPEWLSRVNPWGGSLATGSPWGAMGAVLLVRAVQRLRQGNGRIALVTLAAEGGQGMALVLKNGG